MSFKNALKNLVAHFGIVWALLLYIIIFAAIILGVSLPFVLPIIDACRDGGVFTELSGAFSSLFNGGGWQGLWDGLYSAYYAAVDVFMSNDKIASLTLIFLVFIVVVAFRFFLGLYEIPLATVLDGRMSCNARYGLGGKFFSTLGVSVRYSLAKMLYTILFDAATGGVIYGLGVAIGMTVWLPFVIILTIIVFCAFRFSIAACWAPCVAGGECGVVKGFLYSARLCFKNFATFYSTYIMFFILIFVLGALITVFTLGVGLIVVLPFAASYLGYLNVTEYYNKTGKRYYVDGIVFTPPMPEDATVKD